MNVREHDEIIRHAHALRSAELARLAGVIACHARRLVASLGGDFARPCPPRAA